MENYPQIDLMKRFFEAIDFLDKEKEIPGIIYFITHYNLPKTRIFALKKIVETGEIVDYRNVPVEAIYAIAKDYNISLDWLFFGIGNMRKKYKFNIDTQSDAEV